MRIEVTLFSPSRGVHPPIGSTGNDQRPLNLAGQGRLDAPAARAVLTEDDQSPEREPGSSGLKPYAGSQFAAFCTEEVLGSSRTREFNSRALQWYKGVRANSSRRSTSHRAHNERLRRVAHSGSNRSRACADL
jgi:hypothetical protein